MYGSGPPIVYETVNCKYGCQLFLPPTFMAEHYKDCPNRIAWEEYYRKQEEERLRRENAKMGLRPIITDYGHFTNDPVTGIPRADYDIKAEAAASYAKELAAKQKVTSSVTNSGNSSSSSQQVEPPESDEGNEKSGGEK
jgi:hypothetical protein